MEQEQETKLRGQAKLIRIQSELRAPKNRKNQFGGYAYRSAEDILEAVKPLLAKYQMALYISDTMEEVGGRVYVKAHVTLIDAESEFSVENEALAREAETKKGMDDSQITGTASSYARKYALNGLFCIDDNQDADTLENARAIALAQVVMVDTKAEFDALKKQYYGLIKADAVTFKAFERASKILSLNETATSATATTPTAEEITKQAMSNTKK